MTYRHLRRRARGSAGCSIAAVGIAIATPAAAQSDPTPEPQAAAGEDSATGLQDIVVTAQRRSENLQSVPIAVAAVDAGRLEAAGVTSSLALPSVVAGLAIKSQVSGFSPFIRGVGTSSFGPGIENPVALYVDNVYYASQQTAPSDLNAVSQIAVLKGPQGTLFGRNATGGVIQMTTRDPEFDLSGEVRTELDQYLTSRSFAYVTGPLGSDVAVNLAVNYATQGEGWGRNQVTGNDTFKIDHDVGARAKLLAKLGTGTTIRLNADYADQRNSLAPNLAPAPSAPAGSQLFGPLATGDNRYDVANALDNRNDAWSGGASLAVEQKLGELRAVSITAYRQYGFTTQFSPALGPVPNFEIRYRQSGKQFSQELQLLSPDTGSFKWMVGAFYFWNEDGLDRFRNNFYDFFVRQITRGVSQISIFGNGKTRSIAGFAQGTLSLGDATNLTVGFRYTAEERRRIDARAEGFVATPGGLVSIGNLGPTFNDRQKESRPTWRVSLDHDVTPDVMVYASYNRGFKSGGFNLFDTTNPPYRPERLDAYEVGAKTTLLGNRVRLNPSVFYYDYDNIQLTRILQTAQIINARKARIYGADVELEAAVTDGLSLNAGLEYLHVRITSFPDATSTVVLPFGGLQIVPFDASGRRIPFAATFALNYGATYRTAVAGADMAFTLSGAHNSGYFTEPDNILRQKAYDLLNAEVRWTSPDRRLEVGAFVRNILDATILTQASSTPQGFQADFGNPPRTFGMNVKYLFGAR